MLNKPRNKNRILTKVISLIMAGVFLFANTVYPDSLRLPLLFSSNEKTDQNEFQTEKKIGLFSYEDGINEIKDIVQKNSGKKILFLINGNQRSGKTIFTNRLLRQELSNEDTGLLDEDAYFLEYESSVKSSVNLQTVKKISEDIKKELNSHRIVIYDGISSYKIFSNKIKDEIAADYETGKVLVVNLAIDRSLSTLEQTVEIYVFNGEFASASWAYVERLNHGNNYDRARMIMPDGKVVDVSLIELLRSQGKTADVDRNVKLEGYEFSVAEVKNQKILISKDISEVISDGEMLAILSKALSETDFKNTQDGLPLVITSLLKSPRIFEDCQKNGFIGINQALLDLYKNNPKSGKYLQVLLQVGLEHELRHEAGKTDEFELANIDASRICELCNTENVNITEFVAFLKTNGIIDEKFEKTVCLTAQIDKNVKELRIVFGQSAFSFLKEREGKEKIVEYMEKNPDCSLGHGDMHKIGAMNKAFAIKIVDVFILLAIDVCDSILKKYGGFAVRTGGDEIGIVLPPHLSAEKKNNIRLILQGTLAKVISGMFGFVKIDNLPEGMAEEDNFTFSIYKEKDGFFLLFGRMDSASKDLNKDCDEGIKKLNNDLIKAGFENSGIKKAGLPVEVPSPRISFGIVKASKISDNVEGNYAVSMDYAEYIRNIALEKMKLNGAISDSVQEIDEFIVKSYETPKLSIEEREAIAEKYDKQQYVYSDSNEIKAEHIDNYYPVIKRENLFRISSNVYSAKSGSVFIVKMPPDNFYLVVRSGDKAALMKIEFLYSPGKNLENEINKKIEEKGLSWVRDSYRYVSWLEGWGFKIINDFRSHNIGDQIILNAARSIEVVLEKNKNNFKKQDAFSLNNIQSLIDQVTVEFNEAIKVAGNELGTDVSVNARAIISIVTIDEATNEIEVADDLIEMVKFENNYSARTGSGNVVIDYGEEKKKNFHGINASTRAKIRDKFYGILKEAYSKPALNEADMDTYALAEGKLERLTALLEHSDRAFDLSSISGILQELNSDLMYADSDLEAGFLKSVAGTLSRKNIFKITYNINRIEKEKNIKLDNLRQIFSMPGFYNDETLSNFSIVPYAMSVGLGVDEALLLLNKEFIGVVRTEKIKNGYRFYLSDNKNIYTIMVTKDFEPRLQDIKKIRERTLVSEVYDVKSVNLEGVSVLNNSAMRGIIERANRLGVGSKEHSLEGILKDIILSFVLDSKNLTSVDYSNIKKEVLDKVKEEVREIDALYDEGKYYEIITEADKICLENANTGNCSLKDLLESETVGEIDISQLLAETANWLGATNMKYLSPVRAGGLMRKLYVILKAIQILSENKEFEERYGLDAMLEAAAVRDDL